MVYYRAEKDRIVCLLCRHYCKLKEGQTGICGVNANRNGRLANLVYGRPAAMHIDPVEKKPLYHFLPGSAVFSLGTVGCNFRCPFCQNWRISQSHEVAGEEVSPGTIVQAARQRGCEAIAYTYNEPTVFYPYARDIGVIAKEAGLKNIFVTNGYESPEVIEDMADWVDGANVDLKCWDEGYYKRALKGTLEGVKESLRLMVRAGIWVEVTTLIVPGDNDDEATLRSIARFIAEELGSHVPWHLSAFHPDYRLTDRPPTPPERLLEAMAIGKEAGLKYIYLGNVAFDNDTRCPACGETVVRRRGFGVATNRLAAGRCPSCGYKVEGVWS